MNKKKEKLCICKGFAYWL